MVENSEDKEAQRRRWSEPSAYWTAVAENKQRPGKNFAPAAARNTDVILAELAKLLPHEGRALELASGTGQHICAYGAAYPGIDWQPSDANLDALDSIDAWRLESELTNVRVPRHLDLSTEAWHRQAGGDTGDGYDVMLAANLLHISPWEISLALFQGARELLAPGGFLFVYGCFSRDGDPVSTSNQEFDQSLRGRDNRWGIRDTATTANAVTEFGLRQTQIIEMPANNTAIVVRRS